MDQTVAHPVVKNGLGDRLSPTAPPRSITRLTRSLWIRPATHGSPHRVRPDGAVMPLRKSADLTQARNRPMFRTDHATFLGVHVLVLSVHGIILSPLRRRCRTSNLSPSFTIGAVMWAVTLALLTPHLPGREFWIKRVVFGVGAWPMMMVAVMPMAGARLCGMPLGNMAPVLTLLLHIVFRAVLGAVYDMFLRRKSSNGR